MCGVSGVVRTDGPAPGGLEAGAIVVLLCTLHRRIMHSVTVAVPAGQWHGYKHRWPCLSGATLTSEQLVPARDWALTLVLVA